ncbi:hypothetical protein J6A34_07490 [bacterium]|nr:hypothetical protein [bacterium]
MSLSIKSIDTGLGIVTKFSGVDLAGVTAKGTEVVEEFSRRANKSGQFLSWVGLPDHQIQRVDELYVMAKAFKNRTQAEFLSVFGIGGSKHTVEHMLGVNGLNIGKKNILFFSDVDSLSFDRFMARLGGDITNSNFMIASKSGSTFETKDGMLRVQQLLEEAYMNKGLSREDAVKSARKHFIAVTDKSEAGSELRRKSISENWLGKLFIHDDVGGRFSAFDDHSLFTLAYAGMKKEDMFQMLRGAKRMSDLALTPDFNINDPFVQAAFWAKNGINGLKTSVHQYLGDVFEDSIKWHTQMQNESVKNTLKQIAKVPDAMHHSSEAHFNPANRFAFALTSPVDRGFARENAVGYIGALEKSYQDAGPLFSELVATRGLGLTPEAAGALTQSRGFATVYQELIEKSLKGEKLPEVLDSVLQPHVEVYKRNLKPLPGGGDVVVAGRFSK